MKIVIPGGSGQVGTLLAKAFADHGYEVVILSRVPDSSKHRTVVWDAENPGKWTDELEGALAVINLAGRSVNCRYNAENRRQIMDSRVNSTRVVGEAIAAANDPPKVWLQASTATIYAHTYDRANDDENGVIGGIEPDAPEAWKFSIDVARAWERAADEIETRETRKVLMRSAMTMSPDKGGVFDALMRLVKRGLGGTAGNGRQYISWIHETDFVTAVYFLIENEELSGAVNIASPNPLPNREFMRILRGASGTRFGMPATKLMLGLGAVLMGTETELILKSRKVVPKRLTDAGFEFNFPYWDSAAVDLYERWRNEQ